VLGGLTNLEQFYEFSFPVHNGLQHKNPTIWWEEKAQGFTHRAGTSLEGEFLDMKKQPRT
jgi:hypothetical protein